MFQLKYLNTALETLLPIIGIYLILFTDYNFWLIFPLFFFFIAFILFHEYDKKKKLKIPAYLYTLGLIAIYSNSICGEFFFKLYYIIPSYDKVLHFLIPVYLSFVVKFFFKKKIMFEPLWIFLAVSGLHSFWEVFEFTVDTFSGTTIMQGVFINLKQVSGGLEDTMKDLIFGLLGALIGAVLTTIKK